MTVATWAQPNFTTAPDATTYKGSLDAAHAVASRFADWFAPHAQSTPNMTVAVDAGFIWNGASLTAVTAQSTGTITAPGSNSRIDRIVVDGQAGTVSVVTGTPAVSPVAPAIPAGKLPVAQVLLTTATTSITNAIITDERVFGSGGGGFGLEASIASAATTDLSTAAGHTALITGTVTITSFGSAASTASPIYFVRFAAALTLTYNATSLILPGAANITTAAGDSMTIQYLGSGNWTVLEYNRATGKSVVVSQASTGGIGEVQLATGAETQTGTDTGKVAPVSAMLNHRGMIKAYARISKTSVVTGSFGLSSVTRASAGNYTYNFSTAFANTNFIGQATVSDMSVCTGACRINNGTKTTTSCNVQVIGTCDSGYGNFDWDIEACFMGDW